MPHDQAYYQAENKIEEALKLDATRLDFSNLDYYYSIATITKGGKRDA